MVMNAAYSPHWLQTPHMIRVSLYSHEGVFDGLVSPHISNIVCMPTFFSSAFTIFICSHVCIFLLHLRRIEMLVVRLRVTSLLLVHGADDLLDGGTGYKMI